MKVGSLHEDTRRRGQDRPTRLVHEVRVYSRQGFIRCSGCRVASRLPTGTRCSDNNVRVSGPPGEPDQSSRVVRLKRWVVLS